MPESSIGSAKTAWIARNQWNDGYEAEFSRWIEQLFVHKGPTLNACLRNPAGNSLYTDEDRGLSLFSDCADLPYLLRAYFAWKKRLPFSFNSTISGGRYTNGNQPGARRSFLNYASFAQLAKAVSNSVHSGFFRFFWTTEKTDTYLARVSRESVVPGTVYYDANGHILVVSKVDADGTVWMVDGHPDNSLTKKRFGESLSRGSCKSGGGFRCWRQQTLAADGSFLLTPNRESRFFDAGQGQCQASYRVDGFDLNYHQWVKRMLASGDVKVDPLKELAQLLGAFHDALKERVDSVQAAVDKDIHRKAHPPELPYNIYGAEGEWEAYSTPGRDARLRGQAREMCNFLRQSAAAVSQGGHRYDFNGSAAELVREYEAIWLDKAAGLRISWTDSAGGAVPLSVGEGMDRLFKLSFDPYHCPELRWGDTEAASCADNAGKRDWYTKEQRLRNVLDPDSRAHTTLDWGPAVTPDVHVGRLIERLKGQYS